MENKITFREFFDLVKSCLFGTLSNNFITAGFWFLLLGMPGFWDYIVYFFDYLRGHVAEKPAPAFEWPQFFGSFLFGIGVLIKLKTYYENKNSKLRKERTHFKETYESMSDDSLQDEFERLYGVKNASIKAIKNILGHKDNKNAVLSLFEKAHLNVIPDGNWFLAKGKFIEFSHKIGFLVWSGLPILAVVTFILGVLELFFPGVTQSGSYALYGYAALEFFLVAGATVLFQEIKALGCAVTLVKDYRPEN